MMGAFTTREYPNPGDGATRWLVTNLNETIVCYSEESALRAAARMAAASSRGAHIIPMVEGHTFTHLQKKGIQYTGKYRIYDRE